MVLKNCYYKPKIRRQYLEAGSVTTFFGTTIVVGSNALFVVEMVCTWQLFLHCKCNQLWECVFGKVTIVALNPVALVWSTEFTTCVFKCSAQIQMGFRWANTVIFEQLIFVTQNYIRNECLIWIFEKAKYLSGSINNCNKVSPWFQKQSISTFQISFVLFFCV